MSWLFCRWIFCLLARRANLIYTPLLPDIQCSLHDEEYLFSTETYSQLSLSPSSKENNVQLLLHVWSTDTHRTQQAGTGLMHCLQSHLSSRHCSLMTKNAGSIFSGFKFVLRRPRYLCRPAAEGSGCCLCLSSGIEAREQRKRRGPKKEGKIYFVFRCFNPLV